jgi:predicted permease
MGDPERGRPRENGPARQEDPTDREIREELEFHLEMRTRDNIAAGMTPAEARADAERRFGRPSAIHAQVRAFGQTTTRPEPWLQWLPETGRDVRFAFRSLARRPGFVAVAVLTLALGIGANTAMFSLANAVLLREVPGVHEPSSLVSVHFSAPDAGSTMAMYVVSHADYADLAAATNPYLEGLSAASRAAVHLTVPGWDTPRRVVAELVTANHAETLGLRPYLGVAPGPEHRDEAVAMISHELWSTAFARAPDVLGRTVTVNGQFVAIIGVGSPGYRGASPLGDVDMWLPVEAHGLVLPGSPAGRLTDRRFSMYATLFGRLTAGATPAQAQAALRASGRRIGEATAGSRLRNFVAVVAPGIGLTEYERREFVGIVRVLAGVVGVLLVLACANAANLLLVRGAGRMTELSIRRAIGAGRGRLVRQLLTEAVLLSGAAGAAGLALAWFGVQLFRGNVSSRGCRR